SALASATMRRSCEPAQAPRPARLASGSSLSNLRKDISDRRIAMPVCCDPRAGGADEEVREPAQDPEKEERASRQCDKLDDPQIGDLEIQEDVEIEHDRERRVGMALNETLRLAQNRAQQDSEHANQ